MTWKNCLVLGTKLIGVDCLTTALQEPFYNLFWQLGQIEAAGLSNGIFTISLLITFTIPVVMTAMGFYLIRDGKFVLDRALSEDNEIENYAQRWLSAGVLLLGLYALTISTPGAMRILSNLVVVLQIPAPLGVDDWWERIDVDILPTSFIVVFGLICFKNSKTLSRAALRQR